MTTTQELDPRLLEILACPEDKGSLLYFPKEDLLFNPRLNRIYPIREGIPVMLIDEATNVDADEAKRLTELAAAEGIKPNFEA
ncbi:MAG: Trm112 family protein [Microthrixaceae bacterium]